MHLGNWARTIIASRLLFSLCGMYLPEACSSHIRATYYLGRRGGSKCHHPIETTALNYYAFRYVTICFPVYRGHLFPPARVSGIFANGTTICQKAGHNFYRPISHSKPRVGLSRRPSLERHQYIHIPWPQIATYCVSAFCVPPDSPGSEAMLSVAIRCGNFRGSGSF